MSELGFKRTFWRGPWHICVRCDAKEKLSEMKWQRGKLLCRRCLDKRLLGEREVAIAAVLSDGQEELAPDPKLRNPTAFQDDSGFFL